MVNVRELPDMPVIPVVRVEADGSLEIDDSTKRRLASSPGSYRLVPASAAFAGDLSRVSFSDLVSLLVNARVTGALQVATEAATRTFVFVNGEMRGASSTRVGERLGEVVVLMGFVKAEELEALFASAPPGRRPIRLAVERGLLTERELWRAMQEHVTQLVQATLVECHGTFTLSDAPVEGAVTVPGLSAQGLLMEGLRRIDELARFRERVPSLVSRVEAGSRAPDGLPDFERNLVARVADEPATVEDLARALQVTQFDAIRVVYELSSGDFLRVADPAEDAAVRREGVTRIVAAHNGAFRELFAAAAEAGAKGVLAQAAASALVEEAERASFFADVDFEPDGSLPLDALVVRLESLAETEHGDACSVARRVLSKAMLFLLFVAGEHLEPEIHQAVHDRCKARVAEVSGA